MAKKKKRFDKKNARSFVVVHRSQQDPLYGNENATKYVLTPANDAAAEEEARRRSERRGSDESSDVTSSAHTQKRSRRILGDTVDEYGLKLDGYDYYQHMKPITGSGTFIGPNGKIADPLANVYGKEKKIITDVSEDQIDRQEQLKAIAIDTRSMPEDMHHVLMGLDEDEEGEFETLNDDFVIEAAKEEVDGATKKETVPFDFQAYVADLLAKEKNGGSRAMCDLEDEEEFTSEDEDAASAAPSARVDNRLLDDHFDVVLNQYDDEEIGELDEDDPRLREGLMEATADNDLLKFALDDFEEYDKCIMDYDQSDVKSEKKDTAASAKKTTTKKGVTSAIAAAMAQSKARVAVTAIDLDDEEEEEEKEDNGGDDDDVDAEVAIDADMWFKRKEKAKWDCESVISTYSNLDNLPTTIRRIATSKNRIRLSKKTGLPIGPKKTKQKKSVSSSTVVDGALGRLYIGATSSRGTTGAALDEAFESIAPSAGQMHKRDKNETAAEKRERKRRVKAERRARRAQKKQTKNEYKRAGKELKKHETTDTFSGRSIRRFD